MHEACLEAAIEYQHLGFSVIPIRVTWNGKKFEKRPALRSWVDYQKTRPTEQRLRYWWGEFPDACPGIITGAISGISVVDVDSRENIPDLMTPLVHTISGGSHYYCKYDSSLVNRSNKDIKIDIRSEGGLVVAPPAHCGDAHYAWDPLFPMNAENLACLATVPEEIAKLFSQRLTGTANADWGKIVKGASEGDRHKFLLSLTGLLFSKMPQEYWKDVERIVNLYNEHYCVPPKASWEIAKIIKYCAEKQLTAPKHGWSSIKRL